LGGKNGTGKQFMSWNHEKDFARAIDFIIEKEITGSINIVAPKPIRNEEFMKKLQKAIGIPFGLPISKSMLEIGAKIIQTETELVLKSRNVIPKKLSENGFEFAFDSIEKSLKDLLNKKDINCY
jgi:NAD dependent epimerase/dehydratase family enzyme